MATQKKYNMAITLHDLKPSKGSKTAKKRIARGLGSKGTTAGRGQKGQKSRSGVSGLKKLGMKKLILSMPKLRGFKSPNEQPAILNLEVIEKNFGAGETLDRKALVKKGLIRKSDKKVKILSEGEITTAINVKGCAVSKMAAEKILKVGGKIEA